jgi:catechol 2,3-dioxygenase-like lactoylglutathione lyase family enzyme
MITGINHVTFAVADMERSFVFYRDVLGFKPLCRWNKGAYFLAGETWFCLNLADFSSPSKDRSHVAFTVAQGDFGIMKDKILRTGNAIWQDNISEGDSLYFCDPDGHKLEIHVGDWQSRLASVRKNPPEGCEFFK